MQTIKVLASLLSVLVIGGCSDSSSDKAINSGIYFPIDGVDYSAVIVNATANSIGETGSIAVGARLLASQCAQCHGTYGVAVRDWPDLWGSGRKISNWMRVYQEVDLYKDNMMHMHALAYTADEVTLLKSYYPKVSYTAPAGE